MTRTDAPHDSGHAAHHRRSREEVEALAKNFVATPPEDAAPAKSSRTMLMAGVGGAVVLAGVVVAFFALSSPDKAARPAAENNRAVAEVEELRQRMEAERERQRKELAAGQEYLQRIAASDAAVLKDMTAQADKLADRAERPSVAAPAKAEGLPTPRDETRTASAPAKPAPTTTASAAPATTTAAPQQKPAAAPPKAAPATTTATTQAAPAPAQATTVAQADPSSCTIHVSELSSSGKLTYEDVKRRKGARMDDEGHVFLPPVQAAGGRTVVFEVRPDGCVRARRR